MLHPARPCLCDDYPNDGPLCPTCEAALEAIEKAERDVEDDATAAWVLAKCATEEQYEALCEYAADEWASVASRVELQRVAK